jgi:hypothetical protein
MKTSPHITREALDARGQFRVGAGWLSHLLAAHTHTHIHTGARHKNLKKIKINKQPDVDLSCFILLAASLHTTNRKRKYCELFPISIFTTAVTHNLLVPLQNESFEF